MLGHNAVRVFGIETLHRGRDDLAAMEPAGHQNVHQSRHPRPVSGRPPGIGFLREKVVDEFEARHVPEHHPVRLNGALRHTRRSRGIADPGDLFRVCVDVRERIVGALDCLPEIFRAVGFAVDDQHALETRAICTNFGDLGIVGRIRNQYLCAAVVQPIDDRIAGEQHRGRAGNHAGFPARDVRERTFGILREQQGYAIAALESVRAQRIGELVRVIADVGKGVSVYLLSGIFIDQCNAAGIVRPTIANVVSDVVTFRNVPLEIVIDFFIRGAALE